MTPEMSCERCQELAPWYVAHALSNDEHAEMERHLATCGRCRAALDEWAAVASAMRRADERIPPDTASLTTWANISRQLDEQPDRAYRVNERTAMRLKNRRVPESDARVDLPSGDRPRRRRHAIVEAVAVAALIAISIGVFGLFAANRGISHNHGVTATRHATCASSQATVSLPAHTNIVAIAPLGTDDGWAVGNMSDPKQPTSAPMGLLFHLQNCHWAPAGTPIQKAVFWDISMASPDDGWAVGSMETLNTTPLVNGMPANVWEASQPLALHYTHGSWQQVQVAPGVQATAQRVKMVSAQEGWMLLWGGKGIMAIDGVNHVKYKEALLHYQNGTWTNVPLTFATPTMALISIDAQGPSDLWMVGFDNNISDPTTKDFAAHYSGGAWTTYVGAAFGGTEIHQVNIETFSEAAPNDVWAGGSGLYHFDGARWSSASMQGAIPSWAQTDAFTIHRVVMLSPTQGWAFGTVWNTKQRQDTPIALKYDHGEWLWTNFQIPGKTVFQGLDYFAPTTPSSGWGLGALQDGMHVDEDQTLLYYDSGSWGIVRQQP